MFTNFFSVEVFCGVGREMGNNSVKKQCCDPCQKNLDELFRTISNGKGRILRSDLKKTWSTQIDGRLYDDVESYLFLRSQDEISSETFKKLFLDICKGDAEQRAEVLCRLLGSQDEISGERLLQFTMGVLNSIIIIQESKSPKKFMSWKSRMSTEESKEVLKVYGMHFLEQTGKSQKDRFNSGDLQIVFNLLSFFLHMVLSRMYDTEEKHFYTGLLPKWRPGQVDAGKSLEEISILNLYWIMFLNLGLPVDFQHEWRILYSTNVHGESFSKLSGEITNKGPTIILVKDKDGHVFGGFAPNSWSLGPTYFGDSRSFLFTLYPKMNLYVATNFNENYQYMNVGQQTMPNGLGMGGRLEYFGMWLSAEFGKGYCSESCTTYRNYKMMSGTKEFEISHLEVWGVGPPPPTAAELGERSVLDGNADAKVMLELAGKTAYSEGLREEHDKS